MIDSASALSSFSFLPQCRGKPLLTKDLIVHNSVGFELVQVKRRNTQCQTPEHTVPKRLLCSTIPYNDLFFTVEEETSHSGK